MFVELLVQDFMKLCSDNVIKVNGKEIKAKNGYESLTVTSIFIVRHWNFKTIILEF